MDIDLKDHILWIGGALMGLVALHGLYLTWRSRKARRNQAATEREPEHLDTLPPVLAEPLNKSSGRPNAPPFTAPPAPDAPDPALDGRTNVADAASAQPAEDAQGAEPQRIVIAGKRTEPTVPREQRGAPPEPEPASAPAQGETTEGDDQVMIMWVMAKSGAGLTGAALQRSLRNHGLEHANGVFHKFNPNTNTEWYMVANGVEPGTFDLANINALTTPRIVLLLRLATTVNPSDAFEDMLEFAQDVAISQGGEIRDENRVALNSQSIEQYRQRIREFRRSSQRS